MNRFLNFNFFENMMYKNLLDILNTDPVREYILSEFKKKFTYVWISFYGDIIVAVEVNSEVIFISQEGVFRYAKYLNGEKIDYINLNEYFSKQYVYMSITLDMYLSNENNENIISNGLSSFYYVLEPLISYDFENSNKVTLQDKSLSEIYLYKLNNYLQSYYSLVQNQMDFLAEIQKEV